MTMTARPAPEVQAAPFAATPVREDSLEVRIRRGWRDGVAPGLLAARLAAIGVVADAEDAEIEISARYRALAAA